MISLESVDATEESVEEVVAEAEVAPELDVVPEGPPVLVNDIEEVPAPKT